MRQLCLAASVLLTACASVPVAPPPVLSEAELAAADARLAQGCYDCLIDARDRYARLADGPFRASLLPWLFEAELLITARERELDLPAAASLDRARLLAIELPVEYGADRLLRIVEALPEEGAGVPRTEQRAFRAAHAALVGPELAAEIDWLRQSALREPARRYLAAALACAEAEDEPSSEPAASPAGPQPVVTAVAESTDPPLVTYGEARCPGIRRPEPLQAVRALVPAFQEASLPLSQMYLGLIKTEGPGRALAAAADAYERFAGSSAVTHTYATIHYMASNWGEALRLFDETVALRPAHEDAGLGRVLCLSVLDRYLEAIAAATILIDAGADNRAQAYYWRAWNHRQLEDLAAARTDIERAKRLSATIEIHTLAGIIAFEQERLDAAVIDLRAARAISLPDSCTAAWYLGLVPMRREQWADGAVAFETAMTCFQGALVGLEAERATLAANTIMDGEFKARQLAIADKAIASARQQMYAAAMNAAKNFALSGNRARAAQLGDRASADPTLASEVEVLRDYLASLGGK